MFNRIFAELGAKGGKPDRLMIEATHLKGASDGGEPSKKGALPRRVGHPKGGLNFKLHSVCYGKARLLIMLLHDSQKTEPRLEAMPDGATLLGDKG